MKKKINIAFKLLSKRIFHWNVASKFSWNSMIFKDLRKYVFWDSIKRIDWKNSAKYQETFVKIFEEDKDINAYFFVDIWENMHFWRNWKLKIDGIKNVYEAISLSILKNYWNVYLYTFTNFVKSFFSVWRKVSNFNNSLKKIYLTKEKTSLDALLNSPEITKINSSAIFILTSSIEISSENQKKLKKICFRNDVFFINIFDEFENKLNYKVFDDLSDFSSWVSFDFSDEKGINKYKNLRNEKISNLEKMIKKAWWRYFMIEYWDDIYSAIFRTFSWKNR